MSDIFRADGVPVAIDWQATRRIEFIVSIDGDVTLTIYDDGTYSINPNLTAEQYKQALGMVIDYFTKGK